MAKLSFKVSWLQEEEMFLVKQMSDGVVEEAKQVRLAPCRYGVYIRNNGYVPDMPGGLDAELLTK